jgi:bacterioferritin-associated ferredoxin
MGAAAPALDQRVQLLLETEIFGLYRQGTLAAGASIRSDGGGVVITTEKVTLATGRQSIPPLVRGSHLPGVMDARTAILLAQRHAVSPGQSVAILGTGAEKLVADRLIRLGVHVVATEDVRNLRAILGRTEVQGIELDRRIACDAVIHAGPWRTDPGLTFQASATGLTYLQSGTPIATVSRCDVTARQDEIIGADGAANRAALVCPCMDVTAGEICDLVDEGETHAEVIKRLTSCGMGPCQGMPCWEVMTSVIARASGQPETEIRRPAHRAPRRGLTVAQAAGMNGLVEPDR